MSAEITRKSTQHLYATYIRVAKSFASYNFREYFVRNARYRFRTELPTIVAKNDSEALKKWWDAAQQDLAQLKRAAVVNRMFEAPKLVVEGKGQVMTGAGGGAGMEASAGEEVTETESAARPTKDVPGSSGP